MIKEVGTQRIETDRLILRELNVEDYHKGFTNWCSDPEVCKYVCWSPHKDENSTKKLFDVWIKEYENPYTFRWAVEQKSDNDLVGIINVVDFSISNSRAEIGYCSGSKFWNKGYGTEALKAVIDYLLNVANIDMVVAAHEVDNIGSKRIQEKAGLKHLSVMPKWVINKSGERVDLEYHYKLREEK